MALVYEAATPGGPLRQGELLENVWIHRPLIAATKIPEGAIVSVEPNPYRRLFVVHSDCDLLQDFNAREEAHSASVALDPADSALIPQVLVNLAFEEGEIRPQVPGGSRIWSAVKSKQHKRYHSFDAAPIDPARTEVVPPLFVDFRRLYAVFTPELYEAIATGAITRKCVVPPIFLQDFTHRLFGYLSRVGVPE